MVPNMSLQCVVTEPVLPHGHDCCCGDLTCRPEHPGLLPLPPLLPPLGSHCQCLHMC